jgi:hypothetical protein
MDYLEIQDKAKHKVSYARRLLASLLSRPVEEIGTCADQVHMFEEATLQQAFRTLLRSS